MLELIFSVDDGRLSAGTDIDQTELITMNARGRFDRGLLQFRFHVDDCPRDNQVRFLRQLLLAQWSNGGARVRSPQRDNTSDQHAGQSLENSRVCK